jgi:hypothetical protein
MFTIIRALIKRLKETEYDRGARHAQEFLAKSPSIESFMKRRKAMRHDQLFSGSDYSAAYLKEMNTYRMKNLTEGIYADYRWR